jgi:hypothetical protein
LIFVCAYRKKYLKKKITLSLQMAFQTRSDVNGLSFFGTFNEAFNAWKEDDTIWKISFDDADGTHMRWRPKTKKEAWENEDCLENLLEEYANEQNLEKVYWVWQSAHDDINYLEQLIQMQYAGEITEEERNKLLDRANIKCVMSEVDFVNRFTML